MKKIVFISGTQPPTLCGVGMYSSKLLKELVRSNVYELHLITSDVNELEMINGITYHTVPSIWNIGVQLKIIRILKRINPDIIHFQHPTLTYVSRPDILFLIFAIYFKFKNRYHVLTLHELSQSSILGKIMNIIIISTFSRVIFTNNKDLCFASKFYFKKKDQFLIIPIFPNNYYKQKILVGDYFCYIGMIDKKKGIEYLLKSVQELKNNNYDIKVKILTGFNNKNKYHQYIKNLISKYNIKESIVLYEKISSIEIAKEIAQSFAVILPYNLGISPRNGTFLEAISYKKPVITTVTKYTDTSRLKDHYNCILVNPRNYKGIEISIKELLASEELYKKLSVNSYKLSKYFNISSVAKSYLKLYSSLK